MALEPVAGQVYFSPECHAAYAALGFSPSPGSLPNGVQFPDGAAYFTSRGSVIGQVPGEVVAAAFAVFNPEAVVPAVEFGWSKVDAATICVARTKGAVDQLVRVLGPAPEGLAAATDMLAQAVEPLRPEGKPALRRVAEPRPARRPGGRHVEARRPAPRSTAATPTGGLDLGRSRRHRGRAAHRALLGPPHAELDRTAPGRTSSWRRRRIGSRSGALWSTARPPPTDARSTRSVEVVTDGQSAIILDALGDSFDDLLAILGPWGDAIRAAAGYPPQGPHDLAPVR